MDNERVRNDSTELVFMDIAMNCRLRRHGRAQFDVKLLTRTRSVLGSRKESANVPVPVSAALRGTVAGDVLEHRGKRDHATLRTDAMLHGWRDILHVLSDAALLTRMHLVRTRELVTARDLQMADALMMKRAVEKERVP